MRRNLIAAVALIWVLTGCQNPVAMRTLVKEDGSLNKMILFKKAEKKLAENNMFGIRQGDGWKMEMEKVPDLATDSSDKDEYNIKLEKEFASVDDVNRELNTSSDTLFHIEHRFDRKFRWFYTYLRYSERITPVNRFKIEKPEDYFNREDSLFLDRLPGDGSSISKADSVFLNSLSEKVNTTFVYMAIFREEFEILKQAVAKANLDKRWLDTLDKKAEYIYNHVDKMKGDPFFAEKIADSLKVPFVKPESSKLFAELSDDFNSRVDFMSFANNGEYENEVAMPWEIVSTNADSVAGSTVYWRPLSIKFAFRDYEMYVESRRLNLIPGVISILVVAFTFFLLFKKRQPAR